MMDVETWLSCPCRYLLRNIFFKPKLQYCLKGSFSRCFYFVCPFFFPWGSPIDHPVSQHCLAEKASSIIFWDQIEPRFSKKQTNNPPSTSQILLAKIKLSSSKHQWWKNWCDPPTKCNSSQAVTGCQSCLPVIPGSIGILFKVALYITCLCLMKHDV